MSFHNLNFDLVSLSNANRKKNPVDRNICSENGCNSTAFNFNPFILMYLLHRQEIAWFSSEFRICNEPMQIKYINGKSNKLQMGMQPTESEWKRKIDVVFSAQRVSNGHRKTKLQFKHSLSAGFPMTVLLKMHRYCCPALFLSFSSTFIYSFFIELSIRL